MINELGMKLIPIEKQDGMSDGFVDGTIRIFGTRSDCRAIKT